MAKNKKNQSKESDTTEESAQTKKRMSALEKAYLDQLERLIATPGRSPYVDRKKEGSAAEDTATIKPVFDSGPLPVEQVGGFRPAPSGRRAQPSLETEDGRVRLGADGIYEIEIDVPASDLEQEEDRIAESPPLRQSPPGEPQASQPAVEPAPEAPAADETGEPEATFPCGALVLWDRNRLGIYKEHVESKAYDLVYVVESGGRLAPKGICLFAYDPQCVGLLSKGIFHWMEDTMRWERDALVHHFQNPDRIKDVPVLNEPPPATAPEVEREKAEDSVCGERLVRGRTFTITVGKHQWHGVYWGRNHIGTLVAHNTNRVWNLMHLDLRRFGASVRLGDLLPDEQIREIEMALDGQV